MCYRHTKIGCVIDLVTPTYLLCLYLLPIATVETHTHSSKSIYTSYYDVYIHSNNLPSQHERIENDQRV